MDTCMYTCVYTYMCMYVHHGIYTYIHICIYQSQYTQLSVCYFLFCYVHSSVQNLIKLAEMSTNLLKNSCDPSHHHASCPSKLEIDNGAEGNQLATQLKSNSKQYPLPLPP